MPHVYSQPVLPQVILTLTLAATAQGAIVTFDFTSGTPKPTAQYTATPFDLTVSGVTAHFSSPHDGGPLDPAFSLQSDHTLGSRQVKLTGNYLWPNTIYQNTLDIKFSQPITSITLDFATIERMDPAEFPSPLQVTAFNNSTASAPVGLALNAGQYGSTFFPEGTLTFSNAIPFSLIEITVGPNPWGTVNFMADNITITTILQLNILRSTTNTVVVSWPTNSTGFVLQQNSILGTTNWVNTDHAVDVVGSQNQVIISPLTGDTFYRLFHP
jgi:hypothetical protein